MIAVFASSTPAASATLTPIAPDGVAALEGLLDDAHGHEHLVVGVLAARAALRLQDAHDPERQARDGDVRADRVRAEAQVVGGGLAQHRDPQVALDIDGAERRPLPDLVRADGRIAVGRADDRGVGRLRARPHGGARLDLGRDGRDTGQCADRRGVVEVQTR